MKSSTKILLIVIFVLSLSMRLFIAFDAPYFDKPAYYNIRQIASIEHTGRPLFEDDAVVGGREAFFPPLFHYVMAGVDTFFPLRVSLKLFPNIFAASIVLIVYFLAYELTRREDASVLASFVSATVPVFIQETTNSVSPLSIAIPLLFLSFYYFMTVSKGTGRAILFLACSILLMLTSTISILLILTLLLYLLLTRVEKLRTSRSEMELTIFTAFLVMWLYFLLYKKAMIVHGTSVIFQNLPSMLKADFFSQFTVVEALVFIGIVPVMAGIYIIFKHLFIENERPHYLIISAIAISSIALWLRLVPLKTGLIIMGISLAILFSDYFVKFSNYIAQSKLSKLKWLATSLVVLVILLTSAVPAYYLTAISNRDLISEQEISASIWLSTHTEQTSIIAAALPDADFVAYASERRVVLDNQFIGVKDVEIVNSDLRTLFRTPWKTEALKITDKYSIDYIIVTDTARAYYDIADISYADKLCFKIVYNGYEQVKIYDVECHLGADA